MYQQFFQFRRLPFQLTPDPHFFFFTARHEEAFNQALYGVKERKGFMVLTGEVGTGKTTLSRLLIEQIGPRVKSSLMFNPNLTTVELLQSINHDFGIEDQSYSKKILTDELNRFLLEQLMQGDNALLVVDEAQTLPVECLEEIRLLSNLETPRAKLLQILLIGQPELDEKLMLPQLRQLNQRITLRTHLEPLEPQEVSDYIQFRLWRAGAREAVHFEPAAMELVSRYSKGIPRLVNSICDRALLAAYVRGTRLISGYLMNQAIGELQPMLPVTDPPPAYLTQEVREEPTPTRSDPTHRLALIGLLSVLIGLAAMWWKAEPIGERFPTALLASERLRADEPGGLLRRLPLPWEWGAMATPQSPAPPSVERGPQPAGRVEETVTPPSVMIRPETPESLSLPWSMVPPLPVELTGSSGGSAPVPPARPTPIDESPRVTARVTVMPSRPPVEAPVDPLLFATLTLRPDHGRPEPSPPPAAPTLEPPPGPAAATSTVESAPQWSRDADDVVRVTESRLAEQAALLMLLREWGVATAWPVDPGQINLASMAHEHRLESLRLSLPVGEAVKLDYPVVILRRSADPAQPPHPVLLRKVVNGRAMLLDPLAGKIEQPVATLDRDLIGEVWLYWRPLNEWRWPGPIDGVDPVIQWLQRNLSAAQLYDGPVDGLLGPETERALQRLARRRGLAVTPQSPLLELIISQFLFPSGFPRLSDRTAG